MSFPRYPAYKDSGVEWLGEVPEGWHVFALKRDIELLTSGSRGWAEHYADDGALFLRIGNLTRDSIDLDLTDVQHVEVPEGTEGQRTRVQPGDLLFSITAYLGSVGVVPEALEEAYVSQHVALVRLKGGLLSARWVAYVTLSTVGKTYLALRGYGGTKIQLSLDDVAELPIPTPSLLEQGAIFTFLDRETAKIDALVSDYRALIELLQEKRQAVISHAVTKGLDPTAPMKDSGVEWLGEVPEHWEIVRLKWISPQITVGIVVEPSKYYVQDRGVPALRSLNILPGRIDLENVIQISEEANDELEKSRLIEGDLVAVRSGQPGTTAVVPKGMSGFNCIDLIIIRRSAKIESEYLCWYMNSNPAQRQFLEGSGGAIQKHFNIGTALNLLVVRPPSDEQGGIMSFLQCSTRELDCLITDAEDAITLLQERRSALISAAVTGKIDVRGLVEMEEA